LANIPEIRKIVSIIPSVFSWGIAWVCLLWTHVVQPLNTTLNSYKRSATKCGGMADICVKQLVWLANPVYTRY